MAEPDELLADEAQKGNMQAFAALVERHKGRVYRTLYQVVGDDQDAQDLAQEAFLKVYRSLSAYRGDAAFTTWLHRLTLNLAFDWLRARKRRPLHVPLAPPPEPGEMPAPEPASPDEGPEAAALRLDRNRELREAVRDLPPDYREVVALHHLCQLSYQEVAERLGIPVRTVETRLYRARALLRKTLAEREGGTLSGVHRTAAAGSVLG